ncbi:hypothetical protein [Devosia nitrariae]|uniref:Uncharacterized protein n=1 Tax=Devosia nitrariae TaxID=2071872 RepID=A0ABQ5WB30_9HYPH|nr:hypothetical protein [Devosia nitrariae]GLQ56836.1 hypothetical protein GCM10010862_40950 [Devosia nitrariae]
MPAPTMDPTTMAVRAWRENSSPPASNDTSATKAKPTGSQRAGSNLIAVGRVAEGLLCGLPQHLSQRGIGEGKDLSKLKNDTPD